MEECRKNLKIEAEEKPMKGERLTNVKFGIGDLRLRFQGVGKRNEEI